MAEYFDVVDENNVVIGRETRQIVHKEKMRHRSVHIFIFNSKNQLYLQKRSMSKDMSPGYWESSVSGHLDAGEGYEQAAKRELKEEVGIEAEIEYVNNFPARKDSGWEFIKLFICRYDKPITDINKEEIDEGGFFDIEQIRDEIISRKREFTPPFRLLFMWFLENHLNKK